MVQHRAVPPQFISSLFSPSYSHPMFAHLHSLHRFLFAAFVRWMTHIFPVFLFCDFPPCVASDRVSPCLGLRIAMRRRRSGFCDANLHGLCFLTLFPASRELFFFLCGPLLFSDSSFESPFKMLPNPPLKASEADVRFEESANLSKRVKKMWEKKHHGEPFVYVWCRC